MAGRAYHHGNLQEALIEAATTIVREGGTDAISMRTIAEALGVSRAAPYHHFRDKDAILAAVATVGFNMLSEAVQREVAGVTDPWLALRRMGGAYVRFAIQERALVQLMFNKRGLNETHYPDLAEAGMRNYGFLLDTVRRGLQESGITDRSPESVAMTAWSTVHGLAMLQADGTGDVVRKYSLGVEHPDCQLRTGPDEEMIAAVLDNLSSALQRLGS